MEARLASQLATHIIDTERTFQEAKFQNGTCANPAIPIDRKLNWMTEEYLEVVQSHNDEEPMREFMHEVVQLGALCKAMIEGYVQVDPEFAEFVRVTRAKKLADLGIRLAS